MDSPVASAATIDEERRRRFEAAWLAGEPVPIEDCLPGSDSAAYLPTLEELVHIELEFAWKAWSARQNATWLRDSVPAVQPPSVAQYTQRFAALNRPEIVARLQEQERLVREQCRVATPVREVPASEVATLPAGLAAQATNVAAPSVTRVSSATAGTRRFGNYELLEEIGRGGMGVVYRARQLSADRIVALKVIGGEAVHGLRSLERASAVERFHHEALATARLDHEHIVTIYEVGEVAGEPFFSMQYVAGASLADLLRSGPIEERRAAAYLEPVSRAVAAAHAAGILHRDLKPQNILVEAQTDRALVADFGLAKLLEQPSELTRAGDVMGTPAYMSPEQACDSSRVTAAGDVYSLGATLYHLLTGRPPFQAATAIETLRQVQDDEPVAPSRLNRSVGRDLETICLKCLHKEPWRRYASAAALADDLQRYREGFPVLARPAGRLERTARWCRRNPVLGGALALAVVGLVAALVASSVGYVTTAAALAGKTRALADSERSEREARAVVNQFFTVVSEDVLLDQPGMQPLRNELLQLALQHYQRFLTERGGDPSLLEEIARTHYRVATIQQAIDPEALAAVQSLEGALRIQRDLLGRGKPGLELQEAASDTLNALGLARLRSGAGDLALPLLDEARQLREQLVVKQPDRIEFRRKLASTTMNIGLLHKQLGRFEKSLQAQEEAQAGRRIALKGRSIETASAEERLLWRDLAMGHYNRANLAVAMEKADAAETELLAGIDVLEQLARTTPNDLRVRERLAANYHFAARLRHDRRDTPGATKRYEQALAALEELHRQNPQVVEFQERLALVQLDFGTFQTRRRNTAAAQTAFQRACDLLAPLVPPPDSAEQAQRRRNYAVALRELARTQLDRKERVDAAESSLKLSQEYLEQLIEQAPDAAAKKRYEADLEQTRQVHQTLSDC